MKLQNKLATSAAVLAVGYFSTQLARALVPGDLFYAVNVNSGDIQRFDSTGSGSSFGTAGTVNPIDLALDSAGNLYVSDRSAGVSGRIDKFDPTGHKTTFTTAGMAFPSGMAFDQNGYLYVAMVGNNTIVKYDSSGNPTVFATSGLNGPLALAID